MGERVTERVAAALCDDEGEPVVECDEERVTVGVRDEERVGVGCAVPLGDADMRDGDRDGVGTAEGGTLADTLPLCVAATELDREGEPVPLPDGAGERVAGALAEAVAEGGGVTVPVADGL